MDYKKLFTFAQVKKRVLDFVDKDKDKIKISPHRDWLIVVIVFLFVNVIAAAVGYYLFIQINRGELFIAGARTSDVPRAIDVRELQDVVRHFENKGKTREQLLEALPETVDLGE